MTDRTQSIATRVARDCLATRTRSVGRTVTRLYDHALRDHGVTVSQFTLLTAIALRGPVQPSGLGKRLNLEKSTVSRNVRIMKSRGWVLVRPATDGRGSELELSAKGRRVLEKAYPAWQRAQRLARQELGKLAASISGITLGG